MNNREERLISIQFLALLAMLMAAVLIFDVSVYQAFVLPKKIIFELLFIIWLIIWFWRLRQNRIIEWPVSRVFTYLAITYFIVVLSAVAVAAIPQQAWFGSALRSYGGWLHLELFILFLWLIIDFELIKSRLNWLYQAAGLTGLLISSYGLIQVFGFDPLAWEKVGQISMRATSFLGQPNFLGSLLLLILPLSTYGIKIYKEVWLRMFFVLSSLMQFVCLIFTLSRGAWLGLVISSFIFGLFFLYQKKRSWFFGAILGTIVLAGAVINLANIQQISRPGIDKWTVTNRLASLVDYKQGSIRNYYYQVAWKLIKEAPLAGHGPDLLGFYFYPYYSGDWAIYEVINQATDKAHNFWLDLGLEFGLLGVIWWAVFIALIFFFARKKITLQTSYWCFALLAVFISWQVSFLTLESALWGWVLVGLLLGSSVPTRRKINLQLNILNFLFIILAVLSLWALVRDWQGIVAGRLYRQALSEAQRSDPVILKTLNLLAHKAQASDIESFYGGQIYALLTNLVQGPKVETNELRQLTQKLETFNIEPKTFEWQINRLLFMTALVKEKLASRNNASLLGQLESEFAALKTRTANYALTELAWGNLYFYASDFKSALKHYQEALSLYPDLQNRNMNNEHRALVNFEREQVVVRLTACEKLLKREILNQGPGNNLKREKSK